jgi:phosphohistidine phosphatase SixA
MASGPAPFCRLGEVMITRVLAACCLVIAVAGTAAGQTAVFVVRHAERADAGTTAAKVAGADPDLSDAGRRRAESLAAMLEDANIRAIFVTEYKRTHQTAAALVKRSGVAPTVVTSKDTPGLAKQVTAAAGNVLVVGHSNTVPELLKALGISDVPKVDEEDFDHLFVVIRGAGQPALLRLHYR